MSTSGINSFFGVLNLGGAGILPSTVLMTWGVAKSYGKVDRIGMPTNYTMSDLRFPTEEATDSKVVT